MTGRELIPFRKALLRDGRRPCRLRQMLIICALAADQVAHAAQPFDFLNSVQAFLDAIYQPALFGPSRIIDLGTQILGQIEVPQTRSSVLGVEYLPPKLRGK